jgi:GxxExxY protein
METKNYQKLLYKELSYQIQGAAIEVRKNFGSGLKETIYQNAFTEELEARNIKFEREKSIQIFSPKTGKLVGSYWPDFIIEDKIIIELKAVEKIPKLFLDQIFSYLKNSKYELGYFINFASPKLYIKRIIFTNDRKPFFGKIFAKISCLLVFLFALFSVFASRMQAAEISFVPDTLNPKLDEVFQVDVYLNTQDEEINGLEGKIIFSKDKLSLQEIKTVDSVINLWFDSPHLNIHQDYQEVMFGGVIPGSFNEKNGLILSLVFRAIDNGSIDFKINDLDVALGDGLGSRTKIFYKPLFLEISSSGLSVVDKESILIDKITPENFSPNLGQSQDIFEGEWFVVFSAEDKQSGINHYEIAEKRSDYQQNNLEDLNWQRAVSPYILRDQELKSFIYIKAVDNAGNSRIIPIPPTNAWFWYEKSLFWIIIILGFSIFAVIGRIIWKRFLKH